jgi:tetratricopeptide (TPR) repeat protein
MKQRMDGRKARTTRWMPEALAARAGRVAAMVATSCGVAAMTGALVGVMTSCASQDVDEPARATSSDGAMTPAGQGERYEAIKLRLLARAHEAEGGSMHTTIEPPPGLDASVLKALSDAELDPKSDRMKPLADVLAALASPAPEDAAGDATDEATDEAPAEALHLYAQGRMALKAGNAADAATALEAAARIAPDSPQVWRSLGEAQLLLSRRASGLSSLRRAVSLGLREPGTLFQLAREARKAGRSDEAGPMLARLLIDAGLDGGLDDGLRGGALRVDASRIDPGMAMLALVEAAASLEAMGHSRASLEALRMGLSIPFEEVSQTTYRDEVAEALRYRSAQWMAGGDLAMRLGDAALAREMYEGAAEGTMLDPAPLLARRVYASLLEGNAAGASLAVLGDIERMRGRVDERQIGLIAYVASHGDTDLLARAIGALAQSEGDAVDLTATTRSRLDLAQAAALQSDPARAREVLLSGLERDALDTDVMLALVQTFPATDATELSRAMSRVVTAEPLAASAAASAVLMDGRMAREIALLGEREATRDTGATLFTAAVLTRVGREQDAVERVRKTADASDASAGTLATAIWIAMDAGAWDDATRWADALGAKEGPWALRAKVFGLTAALRPKDAKAASDAMVQDPASARVRDLITAAEMSLSVNDVRAAENLVRAALQQDRYDERGYEAALQLHGPRGAAPNQSKVAQAGAALRQTIPASRLIRLVTTQELASRSLWKQAAEAAEELLEATSEPTSALDLYVTGVERAADTDPALAQKAEAMLRQRVEARPQAPSLRVALARVLAAMDRGADAEKVLEGGYALVAVPDLARARERVVRDALAEPERADAMAMARLEGSPRTIDNTIERAQLLTRKGEYAQAAAALRDGLPKSINLPMSQTSRLVVMVEGLTADQVAKRSSDAATGALELLDVVASRPDVRLPEQIDATRVGLIAEADPTNAQRLLDACADLARRHPRLGLATYARVAEVLLAREDPKPALRFMRGAAAQIEPASEPLLFEAYRLTVLRGTHEDYLALADEVDTPERLSAMVGAITQGRPAVSEVGALRAEVLYLVANALSSIDKTQEAYALYDEVLRREPRHAWTNNNYGYALLSRVGDFARAKGMLEIAYAENPTEGSIIDSIGWLRYHEDRLDDWKDEQTGDVMEGAITLLERAAGQADEDSTPEVCSHLGDALWRAGRKAEAIARWDTALKVGSMQLAQFEAQRRQRAAEGKDAGDAQIDSRFVTEMRALVQSLKDRTGAARAGKEPDVTRQLGVATP